MKISESMVQMSAGRSSEELDMVQKETTTLRRGQPKNALPGSWGTGQLWMDRVRISSQQKKEEASQYSAEMTGRSQIWNSATGEKESFEQSSVIKKIVGEMMTHDVTISSLKKGERISSGDWRTPSETGMNTRVGESLVSIQETRLHFEQEQVGFSSQGRVVTEEGRTIEFSLDVAMDRAQLSKTQEESLIHRWQEKVNLIDPLVISLDGKVPQLTDTRFKFDLDTDGFMDEVSFVSKGSGFLAFDKNRDGKINNGSELFGPGTGNGFQELAQLDSDGNNWIDENDAVFSQLSVWTRDDQGNDKLLSLKEAGLGAIYLDAAQTEFSIKDSENELRGQVKQSGLFLFENGNVGSVQQIDLAAKVPTSIGPERVMGDQIFSASNPFQAFSPILAPRVVGEWRSEPPRENPFQALMDELKSLREKLQEVMEKKSDRGGGTRALSDFQLYELTHLDLGASLERRQLNRSLQGWG